MHREYVKAKHLWYLAVAGLSALLSLGLLLPYPYSLVVFVVPAGIFIVTTAFFKPFVGLMLYSVLFFVRPHEFVGFLTSSGVPIEKIFGILLLTVLFTRVAMKRRKIKPLRLIDYGVLMFMAAAALTIPFSIWIGNSVTTWMKLVRLLVVYFLMTQLIDDKKQLKAMLVLIVLSSIFHASASVMNYYRGISDFSMGIYRAVGLDLSYGHPNSLAATLVFTLPFVYYLLPYIRSFLFKILTLLGTGVMLWCVILTGSRTGMAGVVFFVILAIWHGRNRLRNLTIAVVFLIVVAMAMPLQYQQRLISITDLQSETGAAESARGRVVGFLNGIRLFLDRPVFGYGIGNFGTATGLIYSRGWMQSHSLPGQLLGELGLVGTVGFVMWLYYIFRELRFFFRRPSGRPAPSSFLIATALSLKVQLYLLLFFGLGGHNLYRYNWFIISALAVVMLNMSEQSGERISPGDDSVDQQSEAQRASAP